MPINRADFPEIVLSALKGLGGEATLVEVAKAIWAMHEAELRGSGDIFYTWQYDMRWAGQSLRDQGRLGLSGRKWVLR
ncbi:hypothetical protein MASR2M74_11340 [Paracoccaceae bacterium]